MLSRKSIPCRKGLNQYSNSNRSRFSYQQSRAFRKEEKKIHLYLGKLQSARVRGTSMFQNKNPAYNSKTCKKKKIKTQTQNNV